MDRHALLYSVSYLARALADAEEQISHYKNRYSACEAALEDALAYASQHLLPHQSVPTPYPAILQDAKRLRAAAITPLTPKKETRR